MVRKTGKPVLVLSPVITVNQTLEPYSLSTAFNNLFLGKERKCIAGEKKGH